MRKVITKQLSVMEVLDNVGVLINMEMRSLAQGSKALLAVVSNSLLLSDKAEINTVQALV